MESKKIEGKTFYLMSSHRLKSEAEYNANTFRKSSKLVRVVPFSKGYKVFAHGKK